MPVISHLKFLNLHFCCYLLVQLRFDGNEMKESIVAAFLVSGLAAMSFCAVGIVGTIEAESRYSEVKTQSASPIQASRPMQPDESKDPRQQRIQP